MANNTFIWFPPSMIRIAETAVEEVGGILLFKKVTVAGKKILRLERSEIVAGDPGMVEPGKVLSTHVNDNQWVLFHTHPKRDVPQYMGLSGGDLDFILVHTLTSEGDDPKVSHVLLAESFVHYTIVRREPYKRLREMFQKYKTYRTTESQSLTNVAIVHEFVAGMKSIFQITERFVRKFGSETDDIKAMSILDAIWFSPDDLVTAFMLFDVATNLSQYPAPTPHEAIFVKWFVNQIPENTKNSRTLQTDAQKDIQDVMNGNIEKAGLYYSWSMRKEEFKRNGVLATNDGGYIYDTFVDSFSPPYDYRRDILNSLTPSTIEGGSATRKIEMLKGGKLETVSPDLLSAVANLAEKDMEKHQIEDISPHEETPNTGGKHRSTFRRLLSGPKRTVRRSSSSSTKRYTRRQRALRS